MRCCGRGSRARRGGKTSTLSGRRIRVALVVLSALGCLCALLAVQQELERRKEAPQSIDYLTLSEQETSTDPLGISSEGLELVGVSPDGRIVGYATDSDVAKSMMQLDQAMRARGWSTLELDAQGTSSYIWHGERLSTPDAKAHEEGLPLAAEPEDLLQVPMRAQRAYVLFVCSARDGGSSIVAELL